MLPAPPAGGGLVLLMEEMQVGRSNSSGDPNPGESSSQLWNPEGSLGTWHIVGCQMFDK